MTYLNNAYKNYKGTILEAQCVSHLNENSQRFIITVRSYATYEIMATEEYQCSWWKIERKTEMEQLAMKMRDAISTEEMIASYKKMQNYRK